MFISFNNVRGKSDQSNLRCNQFLLSFSYRLVKFQSFCYFLQCLLTMSLMIGRVFLVLFLLWMQTDNVVVMPGSMTVMTGKLCITIITKVDLPAINCANIIIHTRNPDNTQCQHFVLSVVFSGGSKCNVFILFILQTSRFPKQEKSPPMITMLTRSLTNWKGSGKYNWSWDVVIYPPGLGCSKAG